MAQYTIHYSCGHTVTTQLYGKIADRERYIAWAEAYGRCPDCRADDAAAEIDNTETEFGLPDLTGSDKQIAWARKIRANLVRDCDEYTRDLLARANDSQRAEGERRAAIVMTALCATHASRWWIDHRDDVPARIIQRIWTETRKGKAVPA